jgi:hypothetical protein
MLTWIGGIYIWVTFLYGFWYYRRDLSKQYPKLEPDFFVVCFASLFTNAIFWPLLAYYVWVDVKDQEQIEANKLKEQFLKQ